MPSKPRARVLCVDEDKNCRDVLRAVLRSWRIEAKGVATATQALSLIRAERFDLYLLDSQLPDLDGFELCRRMRAVDAQTPIVFFASAAVEADHKKGLEAGANAYVAKPGVDELIGSIKQFVFISNHATAKVIPFERRKNVVSAFNFDPAAA